MQIWWHGFSLTEADLDDVQSTSHGTNANKELFLENGDRLLGGR